MPIMAGPPSGTRRSPPESGLQPLRDPTVIGACAPVVFAEAEGPVPTPRGRARRGAAHVDGTMDKVSTAIGVVVRAMGVGVLARQSLSGDRPKREGQKREGYFHQPPPIVAGA